MVGIVVNHDEAWICFVVNLTFMLGIWNGGDWMKEIFGSSNLWLGGSWKY